MCTTAASRVVQLTPPGRGAIASLLVEGPDVAALVQSAFRPASGRPLVSYPVDRIVFGHFHAGSHPGEEVVVCRRSEQAVELHCHGGQAAAARIQQMLAEAGCRCVCWEDWTAQGPLDPLAATALVALAHARTQRAAAVLLDQYHGALRRAVEAVQDHLDAGRLARARQEIDRLVGRAELGRHLVQPWRVVLAGPPNAGKSSLINALVGYQRAIVHPAAGTTRDVVCATAAMDGWPVELSDTAGLREGGMPLEQAGIERARRQLASADLVLLVFDSSRSWSSQDQQLVDDWPQAVVIHNKCDLYPSCPGSRPAGLLTSALSGQGIQQLIRLIAERLVPEPPGPGTAVPFTAGQLDRLQQAAAGLKEGQTRRAAGALRRLLETAETSLW